MRWLELRLRDLKHQQRRYEAKLERIGLATEPVGGVGGWSEREAPPSVQPGGGDAAGPGEQSEAQVCPLRPVLRS